MSIVSLKLLILPVSLSNDKIEDFLCLASHNCYKEKIPSHIECRKIRFKTLYHCAKILMEPIEIQLSASKIL